MGNGHPPRHPRARLARAGMWAIVALGATVAVLAALAPLVLRGRLLGYVIERNLPTTGGRFHIGGGHWTWSAAWELWRGRPAPFAFDDVRLADPEGTEVFRAARLSGRLQADRSAPGPVRVSVHGLLVEDAAWRFARMRRSSQIGFLAALTPAALGKAAPTSAPERRPPPSPAATTSVPRGPPVFRIVDARLQGLDATFGFPDWELSLKDVHGAGSLAYDVARGAKPAFVFTVERSDVRGGGQLAVPRGAAHLVVPFTRAWLNRVATTAAAPDQIELNAAPVMVAGAPASFGGRFTGVYANGGAAAAPGISAEIRVQDAVPALLAVLPSMAIASAAPRLAGKGATVALSLTGAFNRLALDVAARGFDLVYRGLDLRAVGLRASAEPARLRARLDELTATSPGGGMLSATGALSGDRATALLTFHHFSVAGAAPQLPAPARAFVSGTLDGVLQGAVAFAPAAVAVERLALTLTRADGAPGPAVIRLRTAPPPTAASSSSFSHAGQQPAPRSGQPPPRARPLPPAGSIALPALTAAVWGGTLTVQGNVSFAPTPTADLTLRARQISIEQVLGTPLVGGSVSGTAHLRGPLAKLAARVEFAAGASLQLFGERLRLPPSFAFDVGSDGISFPVLRLTGEHGGQLTAQGHMGGDGLNVVVAIRSFPFDKLPAFADTAVPLAGRLAGELHLSGGGVSSAAPLQANGQLAAADMTFRGHPLGGGLLAITAGPAGALRVRGQVIDGVLLDGSLTPTPLGVSANATLSLRDLVVDPFLDSLPGGLNGAGHVSGSATARMAPRIPLAMEARLTTVTLALTGPRLTGTPARAGDHHRPPPLPHTLAFHADGPVVMFAQPARAIYRIGPSTFAGGATSVQVSADAGPAQTRATVRGHLDLGALAGLAADMAGRPPWFADLTGNLELDLAALFPSHGSSPLPAVTGHMEATARTTVRLSEKPLLLGMARGRVDLAAGAATFALPITAGDGTVQMTGGWSGVAANNGGRFNVDAAGDLDARLLAQLAPSYVQSAAGVAHVSAHLRGTPEQPHVTAQLGIGGITFAAAGTGRDQVRIARGRIDVDEQSAALRDVDIQVGPRTHLIIGGLPAHSGGTAPTASADQAATQANVGSSQSIFAATLRFAPYQPWALRALDIPVQADGISFATPTASVENARALLRLSGDPRRLLTVAGDVDLIKARIYPRPRPLAEGKGAGPGNAQLKRWLADPIIQQTRLDIRVHSRGGAITVDVPYAPDVPVDVDYQIRGTAQKPVLAGDIRSAGLYSSLALSLYRLFH